MDPISVQLLDPVHFDSALDLFEAQLREHQIESPGPALRSVVHEVMTCPSFGFILMAMLQGKAIGVAYAASHLSLEHGGIIGWLEELYVLPAFRGMGAGGTLLRETESRARGLGWRGLELEVVAGHERAIALYSRHGFLPLSRSRCCRIFRD